MDRLMEIDKQGLETVGFSPEFCRQCYLMGYYTLHDIFEDRPEVVRQKEGFTYVWLAELTAFLSERKMLHLLQPPPGNTGR